MTQGQKSAIKWLAGWTLVVFAAGFGLAYLLGDRKVATLQHYSDSVTIVASDRAALADSLGQLLSDTVAILSSQKVSAKQGARAAEARADSAHAELAAAQTAADSVPILVREVGSLRQSNDSLKRAVTLAEAMAVAESKRATIFHNAMHEQTNTINELNARIQALTPRTPKWLRISFRALQLGGAFYAGMQWERNQR